MKVRRKTMKKGIVLILVIAFLFVIISGYTSAVDTLLSQGKPATASSFQAGNEVAKGNDGSLTTRWTASSATFPQWWKVDLGASNSLNRVDINWYNSSGRSYKYKIEVSTDNVSFTTVVDKTGNTTNGNTSDSFTATGRYVRITVTGASAGWASAYEFKVYNTSGATPTPTRPGSATPTPTGPPPTATPTTPPAGKVLPGKIEAESYDAMSGVATEATSDTGGGLNVGWIDLNDWMDYNVTVNSTANYRIDYRVASPNATGKVDFRVNSTTLASTTIPNTGGWQAWTTVSANVNLSAGAQTIRLLASVGGWNLNWFQGTVAGPTPTPAPTFDPTPTPTVRPTPTPGGPTPTPGDFWGDTASIPPATKVLMFKFLNRTYGKYPDSQVFWSFKSGTINEVHSIAEQDTYDMAANSAGRMYFGLGVAPNAANRTSYWDFIEFTIGTSFNANTTRVDAFGLKLAMRLHCTDGYDKAVGENQATFLEDRAVTFQRYLDMAPVEFDYCAQKEAPYRIVEPGAAGFNAGGQYATYYDSYVNLMWANNGITIPKPGPNGSGLGAYPDLSAAIYRHVGANAGTFNSAGKLLTQTLWADPSTFYQAAPCMYYAKFMHDIAINGLSYGFPYDDVGGYSSFISHGTPQWCIVAIGW
jgi:hypothetical protein